MKTKKQTLIAAICVVALLGGLIGIVMLAKKPNVLTLRLPANTPEKLSNAVFYNDKQVASLYRSNKGELQICKIDDHFFDDLNKVAWGAFKKYGDTFAIHLYDDDVMRKPTDTIVIFPFYTTFNYAAFSSVFNELEATNILESSRIKFFYSVERNAKRPKFHAPRSDGYLDHIYIQGRFSEQHYFHLYETDRLKVLKAKSSFFVSPNLSDSDCCIESDSIKVSKIYFAEVNSCAEKWNKSPPPWIDGENRFHSCVVLSQMRCNLSSDTCAFYAAVNPNPFFATGLLYIISQTEMHWSLVQKLI